MKRIHAGWLLAGLAALGSTAAPAADMPSHELGLLLGGSWADKNLVGGKDDEVNPVFGLRYGRGLNENFNLFGDLVYGPHDGDRAGVGDAELDGDVVDIGELDDREKAVVIHAQEGMQPARHAVHVEQRHQRAAHDLREEVDVLLDVARHEGEVVDTVRLLCHVALPNVIALDALALTLCSRAVNVQRATRSDR